MPRRVMGLQDSPPRASYAGRSERARERVCEGCSDTRKTAFLAGSIEQCSCRESRGCQILRAVLRPALQPVLQGIF